MNLEARLRNFPVASLEVRNILNEAAEEIEDLKLDKEFLQIRLSQSDARMKHFVDPENLRAYIKFADKFEEKHGPHETPGYEFWFSRECKYGKANRPQNRRKQTWLSDA